MTPSSSYRVFLRCVGVPLFCVTLASLLLLYGIGGRDLLHSAAGQLLTWRGIRSALIVIGGLTLVTWLRHVAWHSHEPPPMWFRRSGWLNILEVAIFVAVIVVGVWAFSHLAAPPLPTR